MKQFLVFCMLLPCITCLVCPNGFTLVLDKCLMVVQNPLTHTKAEVDCTYVGGTLVNVHSAIENRAVSDFASKSGINKTWLGLFCFANQNTSSCYYDDNSGTANIYNNFAPGYPLIDGIHGRCVYMSTESPLAGKWVSVKCEAESMPFVCEVPTSTEDPTCVHNYNGYCYLPSTEMSTVVSKFSDAQKICQQHNGNLASIHSKRENDYVKSLFRGNSDYNTILLGGQAVLPSTYSWIDGTEFASFDFRDPLDTGSQSCLSIKTDTGLWNTASCTTNMYFLCKVSIAPEPTPQAPLLLTSDPSDFSNCNTTFLMAPGEITSYGYLMPEPSVTYCSWQIATLGAYRVRFSITNANIYNYVYAYDEYGNQIYSKNYAGYAVISPTNIMNITFQSSGRPGYTGFRGVVQLY